MEFDKTSKNTVKRGAKKATYNKKEIYAILDSSEICTIAFIINGLAYSQPINFGRKNNKLYIHGSLQNRMTSALLKQEEVSLSVFHLDSMKLSKSAFHHSVNYRSVVVIGKVKELKSEKDKLEGLETIINHFVPNRWEYCRKPNKKELQATRVIEISIESAVAKIANAGVTDNKEDEQLDFWAGEIPIKTVCELPFGKNKIEQSKEIPKHILDFYNRNKNGF